METTEGVVMIFSTGTVVRDKSDGAIGIVEGLDERGCIIVRFAPTGATKASPWGEYVDSGRTAHLVPQIAHRMIVAL